MSTVYKNKFRYHPANALARACGIILTLSLGALFFSCNTLPERLSEKTVLSRRLSARGRLSANQLADFFIRNNPGKSRAQIKEFAATYIKEAADEGINSDVAFAQMCLETGFLRFGGLVTEDMHNYCGLGAMDAAHPGERFATEQLGVRAHIQHLQAYATEESVKLKNPLIDPRYNWVHKTKLAVTIFDLSGGWASDPGYGNKIDELLQRMEQSL